MKVLGPLSNPSLRLICFPHAGASASTYFRWRQRLRAENIELASIQYPGRQERLNEPFALSLEIMADDLTNIWADISGNSTFAIFGHSMGASLAFEVSKKIVQRKLKNLPEVLILSGKNPPHIKDRSVFIGNLPDQEFLTKIELRYGLLPEEIKKDSEMLAMAIGVLRADVLLVEQYESVPATRVSMPIPISVFGGKKDERTDDSSLAAWQDYCTTPIKLRIFEGDHFFHHSEEQCFLDALIADIHEHLYK